MFYFIQNFPTIQELVKRQYSGGALGSQLISLIYKKYLQYAEETLIPDSADFKMVSAIITKEDAKNLISNTINPTLKQALEYVMRLLPSKADINKLLNNPEKYVKEIKDFALKYKDAITINDINELAEAYNDRGVLRTEAGERSIFNKEGILIDKLRDFEGQSEVIDLTVEDKPLPVKGELIKTERTPFLSNEEKLKRQGDVLGQTMSKLKKTKTQTPVPITTTSVVTPSAQSLILGALPAKARLKPTITNVKTGFNEIYDEDPLLDEMATHYKYKLKSRYLYDVKTHRMLTDRKARYVEKRAAEAKAKAEADALALAQLTQQPPDPDVNGGDPDEEEDEMPIFGSGLDKREQHIHRFKVLKGELLAGNRNRDLVKELKSLVVKMVKINELEPSQSLMILRELNNL
tara:strand:- start:498 stop:1715 length:1218 start_codon:yes stop_codon:yes gene_type:complete